MDDSIDATTNNKLIVSTKILILNKTEDYPETKQWNHQFIGKNIVGIKQQIGGHTSTILFMIYPNKMFIPEPF